MKLRDGTLYVSPTDLSRFLACRHRTALELAEARGGARRPEYEDPLLEALFALGLEHERRYVEVLRARSASFVELGEVQDRDEAIARTLEAMRAGADVIIQAALGLGRWYGRPDVLRRVSRPSPVLGGWSYEVADTKLARETRGGTILQLGLYCEMLEAAQALRPESFQVVAPADDEHQLAVRTYRVDDFAAYVRLIRDRFEAATGADADALASTYPDPVDHCGICPWLPRCGDRRRRDDHLSLVAGISRLQRRELEPRGIVTVTAVAAMGDPLPFAPRRGSAETYARIRDQAAVQLRTRAEGTVAWEIIPPPGAPSLLDLADGRPVEPTGFARLPAPSPGDVFLDLEGDPLAGDAGREYLFGLVVPEGDAVTYTGFWADDAAAERRAFEAVVDLVVARLDRHPDLHVYHYAPYEPSAFKRLMGRYATREAAIDRLLRGRRFVDLYAVVRQGLRVGVERYSIKNLEPLYGFSRSVDLRDANRALRIMEQAYEMGRLDQATPGVRALVEGYNRDDCVSTFRLREWLEARRADLVAGGAHLPRPPLEAGEAPADLDDRARAVEALRARLLALVPEAAADPSAAPHPAATLAYLLDFHRREDKAGWWEYFRLCELPEPDLYEERRAVAGLEFVEARGVVKKSIVHRYRYPVQEIEIRRGDQLKTQDGQPFAKVVGVDREALTVDLLVGPSRREQRPTALFAHDHVNSRVMEAALFALGERVVEAGGVERLAPGAARDLLLRATPRLTGEPFAPPEDPAASAGDYAVSIAGRLDRTVLPIQGPPGTGKTFTAARMIVALVRAGRRVGVTATSHKVIRNLLDAVARAATDAAVPVRLGQRRNQDDEATDAGEPAGGVAMFGDNPGAVTALADRAVDVMGGTAWFWARPECAGAVDVLVIDEAGQMSLANALAVAPAAADSLVLPGDPRQLDQPTQGQHPPGVGVSALDHLLGADEVMPADRGLFLATTWRLAPSICRFTSEAFYAGRLRPKPGLERQRITGAGVLDGAGLRLVEVDHDGNRGASDEEADVVARLVAALRAPGAAWIDERDHARPLGPGDLRIVTPFNAQAVRIRERIDPAVPVGTVDKFQGQEAPVVIYSMATSRPEDAPHGLEFLYSLNRLNVATSRARCLAIVVASPRLFEVECATARQMRLASALCRYRELATVTTGAAR
ncbi:MAG: TM0106 family RecB-like putative nuclease [Vicinamibacterales bacterium]